MMHASEGIYTFKMTVRADGRPELEAVAKVIIGGPTGANVALFERLVCVFVRVCDKNNQVHHMHVRCAYEKKISSLLAKVK